LRKYERRLEKCERYLEKYERYLEKNERRFPVSTSLTFFACSYFCSSKKKSVATDNYPTVNALTPKVARVAPFFAVIHAHARAHIIL
jgi:hypothetical protein